MSRRIAFTPEAVADRDRLVQFLGDLSPSAANRAVSVLETAFQRLTDYPFIGVPSSRNGRLLIVRFGQGGYAIRYRVYVDLVLVSRVFHTREDRGLD